MLFEICRALPIIMVEFHELSSISFSKLHHVYFSNISRLVVFRFVFNPLLCSVGKSRNRAVVHMFTHPYSTEHGQDLLCVCLNKYISALITSTQLVQLYYTAWHQGHMAGAQSRQVHMKLYTACLLQSTSSIISFLCTSSVFCLGVACFFSPQPTKADLFDQISFY